MRTELMQCLPFGSHCIGPKRLNVGLWTSAQSESQKQRADAADAAAAPQSCGPRGYSLSRYRVRVQQPGK